MRTSSTARRSTSRAGSAERRVDAPRQRRPEAIALASGNPRSRHMPSAPNAGPTARWCARSDPRARRRARSRARRPRSSRSRQDAHRPPAARRRGSSRAGRSAPMPTSRTAPTCGRGSRCSQAVWAGAAAPRSRSASAPIANSQRTSTRSDRFSSALASAPNTKPSYTLVVFQPAADGESCRCCWSFGTTADAENHSAIASSSARAISASWAGLPCCGPDALKRLR